MSTSSPTDKIRAMLRPQLRPHLGLLVLLALGATALSCSERDSVNTEPDPETATGDYSLTVGLEVSNLPASRSGAWSVDGAGAADDPDGDPGFASGGTLELLVRVLNEAGTEVARMTRDLAENATTATVDLQLPADGTIYAATVEVTGSRSRPTGTTEEGLLHYGQPPVFTVSESKSTSQTLNLPDLVPQLWIIERPSISHELRWSPVEGAVTYRIRKEPPGGTPLEFENASLDTTLQLPPGLVGGTDAAYQIQAVLGSGLRGGFSETVNASEPGDLAPSSVQDLRIFQVLPSQAVLQWTAPGDDLDAGQAFRYELRRSTSPLTDANFEQADIVGGLAAPKSAGAGESAIVSGLSEGATYYFALVTEDEANNRSPLSNVLEVSTPVPPDLAPPSAVTDLAATSPEEGILDLTWTAPADEGNVAVTSYEIRYAGESFSAGSFVAQTLLDSPPPPSAPGVQQSLRIEDLEPGNYWFGIRSRDGADNVSVVSNVVFVANSDQIAPDFVNDLSAEEADAGQIRLRWSDTGDNGRQGRAARHEIRFAQFEITEQNFKTATAVTAPPKPGDPDTPRELILADLRAETSYWFASRIYDEADNRSALSNVAAITTSDFEAPAQVADLVAEEVTGKRARMFWTAPGDNGSDGTATQYDFRFSTEPLTEENFNDAGEVGNMPAPAAGGTTEEVTLIASQAVEVYLGIKAVDEVGQTSPLSNVIFVRFGDPPPDAPSDLSAEAISDTETDIEWNAPGGEDYFEVERRTGNGEFVRLGIVDRNGFAVAGAQPGRGPETLPGNFEGQGSEAGRFESHHLEILEAERVGARNSAEAARLRSLSEAAPLSLQALPEEDLLRSPLSRSGSGSPSRSRSGDEIRARVIGQDERTDYTYRVRAFAAGGPSAYSNQATTRTLLAPPGNVKFDFPAGNEVVITFEQDTDTDRYDLERSLGEESFAVVETTAGSERFFTDTGLADNSEYRYRVRGFAEGQDQVSQIITVTTDPAPPVCTLEKNFLDFGDVEVGGRKSLAVIIENTGGGQLQGALALEGCEFFLLEDAPFDLGPGQTAIREIVFLPTQAGPQVCSIATPGGCGTVDVVANAVGGPVCGLGPATNGFGTTLVGAPVTKTYILRNEGEGILEGDPELRDASPAFFFLGGGTPYALAAGEEWPIAVVFLPETPGFHEGILDFGGPGCIDIELFGTAEGIVHCEWSSPGAVFLGTEVGEVSGTNFTLQNLGQTTVSGDITIDDCVAFSIRTGGGPFVLAPGQTLAGSVLFQPPSEGLFECVLSAGTEDCPTFPLSGVGTSNAPCIIEPSELSIGPIDAGTLVEQLIRITNNTDQNQAYDIDLSRRCGDEFTISEGEGPSTLTPGATLDVRVAFRSDEPGETTACYLLTGNENCPEISLSGTTRPLPCHPSPLSHDFGNVLVGFEYDKVFTITNNTDSAISGVLFARCNPSVARVAEEDASYSMEPGASHSFRLILNPTVGESACHIQSTNGICEPIRFDWNGQFPIADCRVEDDNLTVEAPVGGRTGFTIVIANEGTVDLGLDVRFANPEGCTDFTFIAGDGPAVLLPGREWIIKMDFEPSGPGFFGCSVDLGPSSTCGGVSITGVGTE